MVMFLGTDKTTEILEPVGKDGSFSGQLFDRQPEEIARYLEAFKADNLEAQYEGRKYRVVVFRSDGQFEAKPAI
jgi:U3 small nucleolar RNA-associated protein 14